MTRKEMTEIFSLMLLAWPNAEMFKGGVQKLGLTIELWTTCLPEVDFWTAQQAVIKLCRECKFPPSIAEFKERAEKVQSEVNEKINGSWNMLRADMELYGDSLETIVSRLPEDSIEYRAIQAIGGPSHLIIAEEHTYGDGHKRVVERYNYHGFASACRHLIRQARSLGGDSRKAINSSMKQIGEKR